MQLFSSVQRQHCYSVRFLYILRLTFFDRKPLIWPNAIKISREIQTQQPGAFFSCCKYEQLTAGFTLIVLQASLPSAPRFSNRLRETFQLLLHMLLLHYTSATLLHWGLCPKTSTNISFFCSCISAWELYKNAWPHEPPPWKQDPCQNPFYCLFLQILMHWSKSIHCILQWYQCILAFSEYMDTKG